MARQRGRETWRDMALSLGVVVLIVGAVYLFDPPDRPSPVRAVDPGDRAAAVASAAQAASWPVLDPTDTLPQDWTLTVARTSVPDVVGEGPTSLLLGYVTGDEEYVGITEVDSAAGDQVRDVTGDSPVEREENIAGATWEVRAPVGEDADRVLTWADDGRTVVVRGTASADQVRTAAAAVVRGEPVAKP